MSEGPRQRLQRVPLVTREEDNDELFDSDSFSGDSDDEARQAEGRARRRSQRHSSPRSSNSPLCELSSLMEELPVKRGLSKYYQGKSQSFTSLAEVSCVEDLPKKEAPFKRRTMKPCKSYAGGLDGSGGQTRPADEAPAAGGPCSRATARRAPPLPRVSSCAALVSTGGRPPQLIPVRKNLCLH